MHGDQHDRAVLTFTVQAGVAQEHRHEHSLVDGKPDIKLLFDRRRKTHTQGVLFPALFNHIQDALIGQIVPGRSSAFDGRGQMQAQPVKRGFRVYLVESGRCLLQHGIHHIHDPAIHHLAQRLPADLALGDPVGELFHIIFQFCVDDVPDVLIPDTAPAQLLCFAVDRIIDGCIQHLVPDLRQGRFPKIFLAHRIF